MLLGPKGSVWCIAALKMEWNRKLILAKSLFFATAMAGVGWQRFQNIFYLQQGMTPVQIGELKSLGLLLKFVGEPFWCLVADLTDMKVVFALCILMQVGTMEILRLTHPLTFQTLLLVKVLRTTTAPAATFTTMASFKLTEGSKEGYGQQRLFGSLAWGLGAFAAGYCIDTYGMESIFFYTYSFNLLAFIIIIFALPSPANALPLALYRKCLAGLGMRPSSSSSSSSSPPASSTAAAAVAKKNATTAGAAEGGDDQESHALLPAPSTPVAALTGAAFTVAQGSWGGLQSYMRMVAQFVSSAPCRLILTNSLCYGVVMQVPDTYLFISLEKDFHASKSYSGFCTTVSIVACLPLFWYSQLLIVKYGHHRLIFVAQALCVLRLVLLSLLVPSWCYSIYAILLVQLLHGFNFALFWSASVDAIFKFSPKDLASSSMALLNMVFFTGGGAVGSLVWGVIYEWGGGVTYVYLISALTLLVNVLFFYSEQHLLARDSILTDSHSGKFSDDDEV